MNIFILNTGRCGSTTFIQACQHIENYTSAHESRVSYLAGDRLAYPRQHIEADNRLSWLLGRLEQQYGDQAFYVHLHRNIEATARSFVKRQEFGIMQAYREGILLGGQGTQSAHAQALDYIDTVNTNITLFLRDKSHVLSVHLDNIQKDFTAFWQAIQAQGNLDAALQEWNICHNASL